MAATHRVLYDFTGNDGGMLSVVKGEQCTLLKRLDGGWCNVRNSRGSGLVPSNYLQPIIMVSRYLCPIIITYWRPYPVHVVVMATFT